MTSLSKEDRKKQSTQEKYESLKLHGGNSPCSAAALRTSPFETNINEYECYGQFLLPEGAQWFIDQEIYKRDLYQPYFGIDRYDDSYRRFLKDITDDYRNHHAINTDRTNEEIAEDLIALTKKRKIKKGYLKKRILYNCTNANKIKNEMIQAGIPYICAHPDCNEDTNLTKDHIIPVTRYGSDELDNLQFMCKKHNSEKGIKTMEEYLLWIENPFKHKVKKVLV